MLTVVGTICGKTIKLRNSFKRLYSFLSSNVGTSFIMNNWLVMSKSYRVTECLADRVTLFPLQTKH